MTTYGKGGELLSDAKADLHSKLGQRCFVCIDICGKIGCVGNNEGKEFTNFLDVRGKPKYFYKSHIKGSSKLEWL